MIQLIKAACSKLLFCLNVSANTTSFFALIIATKKFSYFKKKRKPVNKDDGNNYHLKLLHQPVTLFLRTYAGDIGIFYEIFWQRIYALTLTAHPKVIVDAGANTGLSALFFHLTYPHAKIIAIEPLPANVSICEKNLQPYLKEGSIVLEAAALTANSGKVYLATAEMDYNTAVAAQETNISVAGIHMQQLMNDHHITYIDLLKLDIENGELELFSKNTQWLTAVQSIIIEIHSEAARSLCLSVLKAYHFETRLIEKGDTPHALYFATKPSGRF